MSSDVPGKRVTIYVRESDLELWSRAKEYAETRRMTASGLVMLALERYLDEQERPGGSTQPGQ